MPKALSPSLTISGKKKLEEKNSIKKKKPQHFLKYISTSLDTREQRQQALHTGTLPWTNVLFCAPSTPGFCDVWHKATKLAAVRVYTERQVIALHPKIQCLPRGTTE